MLFAGDPARARAFPGVLAEIRRLDAPRRCAALYRSHPQPRAPADLVTALRALLGPLS